MATLIVILLIVVGGLLAWAVKLLATPQGAGTGAAGKEDTRFKNIVDRSGPRLQEKDMEEVAERLLKRIDKKIETLRELMRDADKRIETMRKTDFVLPAEFPEEEGAPGIRGARGDKPPENGKRSRIVSLRRKGLTPSAIAREVGIGQGEVELILRMEGQAR